MRIVKRTDTEKKHTAKKINSEKKESTKAGRMNLTKKEKAKETEPLSRSSTNCRNALSH